MPAPAHRQRDHVLGLYAAVALGAGDPVLFDDVAVAALGSRDLATAEAFTHRQLGRLVGGTDGADRLLQTLRVYLADLRAGALRVGHASNARVPLRRPRAEFGGKPIAAVRLRSASTS